jgi:hypothetical protein
MDQKLNQVAADQTKLKDTVEKHDKLIVRVTAIIAAVVIVISALSWVYEHFLSGHLTYQ